MDVVMISGQDLCVGRRKRCRPGFDALGDDVFDERWLRSAPIKVWRKWTLAMPVSHVFR